MSNQRVEVIDLKRIQKQLLNLMREDQADLSNSRLTLKKLRQRIRLRTETLKDIVRKIGWPTISSVGEQASFAAWLIAQHSDRDLKFQKKCLKLIKNALDRNEAQGRELAYLTDRILVHEGKHQLFGTQLKRGKIEPCPIQDFMQVNKRRENLGLEPLRDYLAKVRAANTTAFRPKTVPKIRAKIIKPQLRKRLI